MERIAQLLIWTGLAALFLFFALAIWGHFAYLSDDYEERAARADYWGGLISTGASVASAFFLVAALLLQQHEMSERRRAQQAASTSFERQLAAARHTEVAQSLVNLLQLRARMVQDLDSVNTTREREPLSRSLKAIDPLVARLLADPVLTKEESDAYKSARDAMVSPRETP